MQIGNLDMELDMDGATGNVCNESCCLEYLSCLKTANSNYVSNFIYFAVGGFFSGAGGGAAIGSIIPVLGNIWGAIYGSSLAGTAGYIAAVNIYMNDQKVCVLNYKACILRKNGN